MSMRPHPLVFGSGWNYGIGGQASLIRTLTIAGTPVTSATVDTPYTGFTVSADGGLAPYTFVVVTGELPEGLALNATTGAVAGTPTLVETQTGIVIRVVDKLFHTASLAPFGIDVSGGGGGADRVILNGDPVTLNGDQVVFTAPE